MNNLLKRLNDTFSSLHKKVLLFILALLLLIGSNVIAEAKNLKTGLG